MKRKKEKSDNIWDNIVHYMWYFLIGFVFFVCVLVFVSKTGHCASYDTNSYPFNIATKYVDTTTGNIINGIYYDYISNSKDDLITAINTYLSSNNISYTSYIVTFTDFQNVTTNLHGAQPYSKIWCNVYTNPTCTSNDILSNGDFTSSTIPIHYDTLYRYVFYYRYTTGFGFENQNSAILGSNGTAYLLGNVNFTNFTPYNTTGILKSGTYSANYPFLSYNLGDGITSLNNVDVIIDRIINTPSVTGHATPPATFDSPLYTTGHTPPQNVPPTITVNNYSWTTYTPPAIDDSGIIEVIKSEIQVINYLAGWLKDNLQGMMTNLVNNIKSLFDYLVETIQYYGNLLISNIQNLITTFYNNMVSIGEDITEKLTYIVSPLDTTALQTAIQNTGIYNDYDRIFDMVGDAFGFYNDISEPNTFTIPIDLRNVTILHQTQIVYIDLGWLNSCKTIIRAFMWCVLTFGLLYTIIDSIPDYLQGNDE